MRDRLLRRIRLRRSVAGVPLGDMAQILGRQLADDCVADILVDPGAAIDVGSPTCWIGMLAAALSGSTNTVSRTPFGSLYMNSPAGPSGVAASRPPM